MTKVNSGETAQNIIISLFIKGELTRTQCLNAGFGININTPLDYSNRGYFSVWFQYMRRNGILKTRREGRYSFYSLTKAGEERAIQMLSRGCRKWGKDIAPITETLKNVL